MECLATWACCGCFANVSSAIGVRRFDGAVSAIASPGSGYTPSQPNGCRSPTSYIPIPRNVCALRPEARARCGSAARRDLCGGCWVTGIPTATVSCGQSFRNQDQFYFLLHLFQNAWIIYADER